MALGSRLRKYAVAAFISARDSSSNRGTILANAIATSVTLVALFAVYLYVFSGRESVRGVSVATALWSMAMYTVYWATGTRNILRDIGHDVKYGLVESMLSKPVDYVALTVAKRLGRQIWVCAASIVVIAVTLTFMAGPPPMTFSFVWLLQFGSLAFFGFLLSIFSFAGLGLTAFWLDDNQPVMWIFDKSAMVLGGAMVPVALFPPILRTVAEWSPMGAMLSFAQAFSTDFGARFPHLLLAQLIWCVVACLVLN